MNKTYTLVSLLLMTFIFSSCYFDCESGEGEVTKIERELSGFDQIDLRGSGNVIIEKSNKFRFSVETNENLIPLLESKIKDGVLVLKTKKCVTSYTKLNYYISMPSLVGLHVSGSGNINCKDVFEADDIELSVSGSGDIRSRFKSEHISSTISGSGDITVDGKTMNQEIRITGSGDYYGFKLKSDNAIIKIMGSGEAEINSRDEVEISITGSGDVIYRGSPDIQSSITGSGSIKKK